ncbi:MAG: glycosyltransferase family 4 protein [Thermoplasmata archaeon]
MRIVIACAQYPPAHTGYAQVASRLTAGLTALGQEVRVLTEGRGCSRVGRAAFLNSSGRRLLREGADVVQVIGPTPLFSEQVVLESARLGLPVAYYIHAFAGLGTFHRNPPFRFVDWVYLHTYYRRALRFVTRATSSTADFATSFGLYRGPWAIVPNGVADPCLDSDRLPRTVGPATPSTRLRALFVGQLRPYKGVDCLLRAVQELRRQGKEVELTIVGEGPERSRLNEIVTQLDLQPLVKMRGLLDAEGLHSEYLSNDVLVLPSRSGESFGIVLLEGRLHGLQLVASDLPGVREVVHEIGGTLVPPNDVPALSHALLSLSPLPTEARVLNEQIAQAYSWKRIVSMYLDVYRSMSPGTLGVSPGEPYA